MNTPVLTDAGQALIDPKFRAGGDRAMAPIDRILEIALTAEKVDLSQLERLYEFKRKYDADQAKNAFVAAMAKFKAEPVYIEKDKHVDFTSSKGRTSYWHASIGNVVNQLVPALAKHGFSHRWDHRQENGNIVVTCILTHEQGHSESYTMAATPDVSGNKNSIQAISSTGTYLQRYSLLGVTGYATVDQPDDDGASAELTPEQIEAREKQAAINKEWERSFNEADTPAALAALQRDLVKQCGGPDMVPEELKGAYAARLRELQKPTT